MINAIDSILLKTNRKHNFSPGPATIPQFVLEEAATSLLDYNHLGMSIAEISHRSPTFLNIIEEATQLIKDLYGIKDEFEVLWMSGGASAQLAIAPMNFIDSRKSAGFVNTGFWANRAIEAAAQICPIHVLASSKETQYDRIPKIGKLPKSVEYLHIVSNETIDGTQYHEYPSVSVPLVADMTSDFLTRPLALDKFGLIFASAQKNLGIAGITCVLIRKDMLNKTVKRTIPTIFNYKTHATHQSLYHTCPTFPIYVSLLFLKWIKAQGGLLAMQEHNQAKAQLLYNAIDKNPYFKGSVQKEDRSVMNVCFRANNASIETAFLDFAEKNNIVGIKGFPTVGGFRASIYNGMPMESVQALADALNRFVEEY